MVTRKAQRFFFIKMGIFFLKLLKGPYMLQGLGVCARHPHFLKLAPTLGSVESSIPHGLWRFYFFSNFFPS
jgi:hypothetical protein